MDVESKLKINWVKEFSNTQGFFRCITHDRRFHADDIIATLIIAFVFWTIEVVTAREYSGEHDLMYDIGFGEYDHHQPGGNGKRENGVPYAASGLIWRDFGRKCIKNIAEHYLGYFLNDQQTDFAWSVVDRELIQGIDASDNAYRARVYANGFEPMTISKCIGMLNYLENADDDEQSNDVLNEKSFNTIITCTTPIFLAVIINATERAVAAEYVREKYNQEPGEILILDRKIPWQEGVAQINAEIINEGKEKNEGETKRETIKYVILPSHRREIRIKSVSKPDSTYETQVPFPEEWWGLSSKQLQYVTGISDFVFCHRGYACGCKTLEGAKEVAMLSLKMAKETKKVEKKDAKAS